MNKENWDIVKEEIALAPIAIVTDTVTVGLTIDTEGFESITFNLMLGVTGSGDVTQAIYESDDSGMSGEALVPASHLLGAYVALDTAGTINSVGAVITKKFTRAKYTSANSAATVAAGTAILGHPHRGTVR